MIRAQRGRSVVEPAGPVQASAAARGHGARTTSTSRAGRGSGRRGSASGRSPGDRRGRRPSAAAAAASPRRSRRAASRRRGGRASPKGAASGRHRAGGAEEDDVEIHAVSLGGSGASLVAGVRSFRGKDQGVPIVVLSVRPRTRPRGEQRGPRLSRASPSLRAALRQDEHLARNDRRSLEAVALTGSPRRPRAGSAYPRAAIDQSVSYGCTT